ncbi:helix-turn-helix domain-containing protein [Haloarchaeobius sp. TZWWS8]|uniref:helix-turn-helix domain-containing protein n=1 Tax=Haloarchaeobius sp. TZWWS8 TaxID=3446121 RepID=UPI003EBEC994
MVTIAEFAFEPNSLPLSVIFDSFPDATIELERVVPTGDRLVPYFWIRNVDKADVTALFDSNSDISNVKLVDVVGPDALMRAEWEKVADQGVLNGIFHSELSLLSATGTRDEWRFDVRAEAHESIGTFQTYLQREGIPARLGGIHTLASAGEERDFLTETQREALLLAFERGYYASPREVTLEEIAAELRISRQALASRLRRGTNRLIARTVSDSDGTGPFDS